MSRLMTLARPEGCERVMRTLKVEGVEALILVLVADPPG